jgi:hypothetical protein
MSNRSADGVNAYGFEFEQLRLPTSDTERTKVA